jgi:ATP-binding protein involved in chromosome partitioning
MVETMPSVTEREVLAALSKVQDPELMRDLVSLGMIKEVKIDGGRVAVTVELTTPACPLKNKIRADVEAALRAVPGVEDVGIEMTGRVRPAVKEDPAIPGVKHVVLVGAGKGGVGKSTCAVNLALALKRSGASAGLLDADFYGPSIPLMLGLDGRPSPTEDGKGIVPLEKLGIKAMSIGLFIDSNQAMIWRGPMLHGALVQMLREVTWGELDYLIVDLPPGTGDVPLSVSQTIKASGAVLVTTPQDVSLADVKKAKLMFDKVRIPVLGLVENMSNFICPHCQTATPIFATGGGRRAAEQMGIPFLGEIPLDLAVRVGGDEGKPIVSEHPESPQAEAFMTMARNIAGQVSCVAHSEQSEPEPKPAAGHQCSGCSGC